MIPQVIPAWFEDAACAGSGHLFFHADGERAPATVQRDDVAKRMCARCPVIARCLEYAMTNDEREGVWGGLSADERETLRVQRGGAPRTRTGGGRRSQVGRDVLARIVARVDAGESMRSVARDMGYPIGAVERAVRRARDARAPEHLAALAESIGGGA